MHLAITTSSALGYSGSHDQDIAVISGLKLMPHYITPEQEVRLLQTIDQQMWLGDLRRRVQHYGWRYDYKARAVDLSMRLGNLPEWLSLYCQQLYSDSLFLYPPDQVIVNEYQPGQGIAPHIDCVPCFKETIASLSLGSPCVMDFTHNKTQEKISLLLEPRSLIVLTGDARYLWQHSIAPRKTDRIDGIEIRRNRRVSLTFRNVIVAE